MYISADALQAMHQEIVEINLRRSEQRRMVKGLKEREHRTDTRAPRPSRHGAFTGLIKATRAFVTRP